MKSLAILGLAAAALLGAGCENMGTAAQSKTVQGSVLGAGLGALGGGIIGNQSGRAGEGAAVGAVIGGLGGGLMGNALEENSRAATNQAIPPASTATVKFCPVGGEVYTEDIKYCPRHGVELKVRE